MLRTATTSSCWRLATTLIDGHARLELETKMLDLIFIAVTVVFFLIAIAYVRGCEKLQ
jgi:succinate-acetate transporter protein